jgi:glutamate carboxypeptidase
VTADQLPASLFDLDEILEGVQAWVGISSPTNDVDGVNRMMDAAATCLDAAGATIERHPGQRGCGDAVLARMRPADKTAGILVLGHLDTVHSPQTFGNEFSVRREGDRVYGPGILDMKSGTYLACYAIRLLMAHAAPPLLPVTFLLIPDEEVGSPTTRALIETEARKNRYVLVPEPAQDGGNLITGRWAFQRFVLRAFGRPAHAGATLDSGRSAIREIAEQVIDIESMSEPDRNTSLAVGVVRGGQFVNVVPTLCEAEVLAVTSDEEEFARVRAALVALKPHREGVRLNVALGPVRPLFTPTREGLALYEHARRLARGIGFDPGHGSVGGGSDGNFTGALGIATLDGLGACGDGFHTQEEHILASSLVPRGRLLAALLQTLG